MALVQKEEKEARERSSDDEEDHGAELHEKIWPSWEAREAWLRALGAAGSGGVIDTPKQSVMAEPTPHAVALCFASLLDHLVPFGVCSWDDLLQCRVGAQSRNRRSSVTSRAMLERYNSWHKSLQKKQAHSSKMPKTKFGERSRGKGKGRWKRSK